MRLRRQQSWWVFPQKYRLLFKLLCRCGLDDGNKGLELSFIDHFALTVNIHTRTADTMKQVLILFLSVCRLPAVFILFLRVLAVKRKSKQKFIVCRKDFNGMLHGTGVYEKGSFQANNYRKITMHKTWRVAFPFFYYTFFQMCA